MKRAATVRNPAAAIDIKVHEPEARSTLAGSGDLRVGVADLVGRGGRAALVRYLVTCSAFRQ